MQKDTSKTTLLATIQLREIFIRNLACTYWGWGGLEWIFFLSLLFLYKKSCKSNQRSLSTANIYLEGQIRLWARCCKIIEFAGFLLWQQNGKNIWLLRLHFGGTPNKKIRARACYNSRAARVLVLRSAKDKQRPFVWSPPHWARASGVIKMISQNVQLGFLIHILISEAPTIAGMARARGVAAKVREKTCDDQIPIVSRFELQKG